jgi:hypothetical protein
MKRAFFAVLLLLIIVFAPFADEQIVYEPPFSPQSAEIMAQGGSFNANARGFYSLFSNPAAYAGEETSFTITSVMPWLYAYPNAAVFDALVAIGSDPFGAITGLNDLLTGPGFGAGVSTGFGYVGHGMGLGLIGMMDLFALGPNTLGINVDSNITVGFVGGFALPIKIGGLTLKIGGALRPMYRVRVPKLGINTFASLLSDDGGSGELTVPVYHGVGLGIDGGAIVEFGPLVAGLALRDLFGTSFQYTKSTLTELIDALAVGSLPQGGDLVSGEVRYVIPMTVHMSAAFHPKLGAISKIIDPIVHLNYEVPVVPAEEGHSFWTSFHVGAEIAFFSIVKLRAGLNQGYITAGVGLHLLFVDLNVAYFGRELGSFAGAKQNQGLTAELAFRF